MTPRAKKFIIFAAITLAIFSVFSVPSVSDAILVPCGVTDPKVLAAYPSYSEPCKFGHFMDLINIVIRFILVDLAVPIAAIMFFYAGVKMVTAGGSAEAKSQAKAVFTNTVLGLVFIAGAWLIIRTLLSILGYQGAWIGF